MIERRYYLVRIWLCDDGKWISYYDSSRVWESLEKLMERIVFNVGPVTFLQGGIEHGLADFDGGVHADIEFPENVDPPVPIIFAHPDGHGGYEYGGINWYKVETL